MHPITEKLQKLRQEQYQISMAIIKLQNSCEHDWKFAFEETKGNINHDYYLYQNPPVVKHFKCSICEIKKTEE